jgi:hypothetical protein
MREERTVIVPVHGISDSADWVVYRVRTQNGWYALGIHRAEGRRKFAVITNVRFARSSEDMREAQDSEPLVGGRSLFSVPYQEWIGHALEIGALRTSKIVSVDPETDPHVIEEVSKITSVPRAQEPKKPRSPSPQREVELAEGAANILQVLYSKHDLFEQVRRDVDLERRLRTSLESCVLLLRALSERAQRDR